MFPPRSSHPVAVIVRTGEVETPSHQQLWSLQRPCLCHQSPIHTSSTRWDLMISLLMFKLTTYKQNILHLSSHSLPFHCRYTQRASGTKEGTGGSHLATLLKHKTVFPEQVLLSPNRIYTSIVFCSLLLTHGVCPEEMT